MIKNDFYSQENVGPFEIYDLGDFELRRWWHYSRFEISLCHSWRVKQCKR